ncbi:MAG: type II secretion system inner membrane protein GspF [Nannocystales bacterium]
MPAYEYTGLNAKGKNTKGVVSADTVAALKAALKRDGVFLTSVKETSSAGAPSTAKGSSREVDLNRFVDRVKPKMVAQVTRLLGTLLGSGVTLPESLAALTDQVESPRFKGILSSISEKVNQGSSLGDTMAEYPKVFPKLYTNMIRAGEASGSLETVLFRLAEFMEKELEIRSKVNSALFYPVLLGFLGVVLVIVLMVAIVPKLTNMFDSMAAELPWNTKLLIWMSDTLSAYWYLFGLGLAFSIWAFRKWRSTEGGRWRGDSLVLQVPVMGDLLRKVAISRFSRTLETLLASGVQLLEALEIVSTLLGNVVLEDVVAKARDNIREGQGIAPALKQSGHFPPLVTHMIAVGERSGQLEQMLGDVADAYDRETNTTIARFTAMLEPLMIVVMGIGVGFVVFSIMRPIMMLTEMAGQT